MKTLQFARSAAICWCLWLGTPLILVGQARPLDPWKKVPATPTTCFADADFDARVHAASQEMITDKDRQQALNDRILERFNKMDPMEKMSRMQAFMMKNPQAAAKMIETSANLGTDAGTAMPQLAAAGQRLEKERDAHKKAMDAAIDEALKPLRVKEEALVKAKTTLIGEAQVPAFTTAAAYAEYVAIIGEENAAIEKACAPFFGAKGRFPTWLEQYRTEISDKEVAFSNASDAATMQQVAIIETPDGGFQSVGVFDGARNYLRHLDTISRYRRAKLAPTIPLEKT